MSRQGVVQQMPPLFLSQRQHQQLERNFTEPYRRQIAELQNQVEFWQTTSEQQQEEIEGLQDQVGGLVAAGTFPDTIEQLTQVRTFTTDTIIWFNFPSGLGARHSIAGVFNSTGGAQPAVANQGARTALIIYDYRNKRVYFYQDGDTATGMLYDGAVSVDINYDPTIMTAIALY